MLRSTDELEKGFRTLSKKSKKKCANEIEEMRKLTFFSGIFFSSFYIFIKENKGKTEPWGICLYHVNLLELFRASGYILFLSINGLYRNAYDCIRHALESVVQAIYIDSRHPDAPLATKIEILKEIEDKRDYHVSHLIGELRIGHKKELQAEYKELSRMIHPSHMQVMSTLHDIKKEEMGVPTSVDCKEVSSICESMRRMYDIFFFIILEYHPELKEGLKKDAKFVRSIKLYKLHLVSSLMGIKI